MNIKNKIDFFDNSKIKLKNISYSSIDSSPLYSIKILLNDNMHLDRLYYFNDGSLFGEVLYKNNKVNGLSIWYIKNKIIELRMNNDGNICGINLTINHEN